MKFITRKGHEDTTIRKVVNDDKTKVIGVVGTVGDMLKVGLLEWCEYDINLWCFLSAPGSALKDRFGKTREEATAHIG